MSNADSNDVSQCGVVLVTTGSLAEGQAIAKNLIDAKLAACISLYPVTSIYRWDGEINHDQEYQLVIKTDLRQFSRLAQKIKTLHSYEVPEIIALPIVAGDPSYLEWLGESLAHDHGVVESS